MVGRIIESGPQTKNIKEYNMTRILSILIIALALSVTAFAQEKMGENKMGGMPKATDKDKTEKIPSNGHLKRGAPLTKAKKVDLVKVIADPNKFVGRNVLVEGVIVRSCKSEGCWLELAPNKDSKSIRVTMKGHSFFIPLDSAGADVRAQGEFKVKVISAEEVKEMTEKDGAKFDKINADGTVTEVSFEATGVELTRKQ